MVKNPSTNAGDTGRRSRFGSLDWEDRLENLESLVGYSLEDRKELDRPEATENEHP